MSSYQRFNLHEYAESGCMQMEILALGIALWRHTNGIMCNDCPKYHGGNCESLKKMERPAVFETKQPAGETVREEASRRGIGIKEVRRQRRASVISPKDKS